MRDRSSSSSPSQPPSPPPHHTYHHLTDITTHNNITTAPFSPPPLPPLTSLPAPVDAPSPPQTLTSANLLLHRLFVAGVKGHLKGHVAQVHVRVLSRLLTQRHQRRGGSHVLAVDADVGDGLLWVTFWRTLSVWHQRLRTSPVTSVSLSALLAVSLITFLST